MYNVSRYQLDPEETEPRPSPTPATNSAQGWQKQTSGQWAWMGPGPEPSQDQWPPEVVAQRQAAAPPPAPPPGPGTAPPNPPAKGVSMRLGPPVGGTTATVPGGSAPGPAPAISQTPPPAPAGGPVPAPAPGPAPAAGGAPGLLDVLRGFITNPESGYDTKAGKTLAELASGPNAQEQALYKQTGTYGTTSGADESLLRKKYQDMIENGGFDAATKQALTGIALETAATPFSVERERASRLAASTNNPLASAVSGVGLARDASRAMTDAARKNTIDIFNERERQKEAGLRGTGDVAGIAANRQQFGITSQAGQNAQQIGKAATAASGLTNLGQNIFGRKTTGAQGLMTLAQLAAQQQAAQQAAQDAILKQGREDHTEGASTTVKPR